jgi:hypothetical protein
MDFDWQPVEGLAYNLARQCDTPVGRVLIKQTRPGARKFLVRIGHDVISRYEPNLATAMMKAEEEVQVRVKDRSPA